MKNHPLYGQLATGTSSVLTIVGNPIFSRILQDFIQIHLIFFFFFFFFNQESKTKYEIKAVMNTKVGKVGKKSKGWSHIISG